MSENIKKWQERHAENASRSIHDYKLDEIADLRARITELEADLKTTRATIRVMGEKEKLMQAALTLKQQVVEYEQRHAAELEVALAEVLAQRAKADEAQGAVAYRTFRSGRWCFAYSPDRHLCGSETWEPLYTHAQPAAEEVTGEPFYWLEAEESARGADPRDVFGKNSMFYSTRMSKNKPTGSNPCWPLYLHPAPKASSTESALLQAIRAQIDHAVINDHRLVPRFGKALGDRAVCIESLEAAIEGVEKGGNSESTLICPKCSVDRLKAACPSQGDCGIAGAAHEIQPAADLTLPGKFASAEDMFEAMGVSDAQLAAAPCPNEAECNALGKCAEKCGQAGVRMVEHAKRAESAKPPFGAISELAAFQYWAAGETESLTPIGAWQARAALQQQAGGKWQSIETAPKDRTMFVARGFAVDTGHSSGHTYTTDPWCVWRKDSGGFERWPHKFQPTHWLPLPAAPTLGGAK